MAAQPHEPEFFIRHARRGGWLLLGSAAVIGVYLASTLEGPNRGPLGIMTGAAALCAVATLRLPLARLLASPRGAAAYFATSSWVSTVVLGIAIGMDGGGASSPLPAFLSVVLVYGALAFPPVGVLWLGMLHVVGLFAFQTVPDDGARSHVIILMGVIATTTVLCALTAETFRSQLRRQARLAAKLAALADSDGLTGCLNHRAFHERLEAEASRAGREGRSLALVVLDIDHFKRVNDEHGHPRGDVVLAGVGEALRGAVRPSDVVARLGGEEFAVLAPGLDAAEAEALAERARSAVAGTVGTVPVTASAGASVLPDPARSTTELLDQADEALYRAKRAGRDQVAVYQPGRPPDLAPLMSEPGGLAARVREVIAEPRLTALYQPIVSLLDGRIMGYEALARITESNVSPEAWLDAAEEAGMRDELEAAMWDVAFAAGPPPSGGLLFVNASPKALASGLLHRARRRLPPYTAIEVIERHTIDDAADLAGRLSAWTREGIPLAVDDMGGGAGLDVHQLLALAPTYLKLDRSLVAGVRDEPNRAALITALARFAQDSGSHLIAEGIEHEGDIAALVAAGVAYGQGYLFARPGPPWPRSTWKPGALKRAVATP